MSKSIIPDEIIQQTIFSIRGLRVMIDVDLARLYAVEVRVLNQAVKRNAERFPDDFAFRLNAEEVLLLKSQSVISRGAHGGSRRAPPMVFTEQGVAMLSGILASPRAIAVNVAILRTFVRMRQLLSANSDLARKLAALEAKYDKQFQVVFNAIHQLMAEEVAKPVRAIGFKLK